MIGDHLSRASSNSSYPHHGSPPPNDFAANFESSRFDSSPSNRASPPAQKPQSPPQLVIPDIAIPATTVHDEPPIISAPDGDGVPSGPQLHIVSATPIGGAGINAQHVPFLQQGTSQELGLGAPAWNQQTQHPSQLLPQPSPQPPFLGSIPTTPLSDLPSVECSDSYISEPGYPENHQTFPHTPSYNGSPFSQYSELPTFGNGEDNALDLFQTDTLPGITIREEYAREEYDPTDYDDPNKFSLLTFDDSYMTADLSNPQAAVTPSAYGRSSPMAYDPGSPASSNGLEDEYLSRASSNSSYPYSGSPPPNDFTVNFESLCFDSSPSWATTQIPTSDRTSSPVQRPQSPPQLVIPATTVHDEPPIINVHDGNGVPSGLQLHIVPTTPIGGGGISAQHATFLQQGTSQELEAPAKNQQAQHPNQLLPRSSLQQPYFGSNFSSPGMSFANRSLRPPTPSSPGPLRRQRPTYPVSQVSLARSRSMSDMSLRPPMCDTPASNVSTVNMHDVLPPPASASPPPSLAPVSLPRVPSSAGPHQTRFSNNLPPTNHNLPHHFSFGPPNTSYSPRPQMSNNDFLSPHISAASLRRAKSDGLRTPGFGHLQVRPEYYCFSSPILATTSAYPPPGPSSSEFIRNISSQQFLHPTQALPSIAARDGHHRRSSSGSRKRPYESISGPNSAHAIPQLYYDPLSASESGDVGPIMPRRPMDVGPSIMSGVVDQGIDFVLPGPNESAMVAKENVTALSVVVTSQKRRKQPANFQCPIPGCGRTFTRQFNLKGHLRSHAEQKPYTCKWSECQKGFARRYDCKRHEQSHLNNRPDPSMVSGVMDQDVDLALPGMNEIATVTKQNVTTRSTADASQKRRKQPANFQCPIPGCGSTFTRRLNLKGHMRSHAEQKPYTCKWRGCQKGFARLHDCKRHEWSHSNVYSYPCKGCKKRFPRMDALNRHLQSRGGAECRQLQKEIRLDDTNSR